MKITHKFEDHSAFVEIKGDNIDKIYNVQFIDNEKILYQNNIKENNWTKCNKKSSIIKIFTDNILIFEKNNDLINKEVFNILDTVYFNNKYDGFFIECGAYDGIEDSCCLNFEKLKNWKGVNIEANKTEYEKLILNRPNSINLNLALYNKESEISFILDGQCSSLQIDKHVKNKINTISWKKLINDYNINKIDLLCLDVEGSEKYVLENMINCEIIPDVICIEVGYEWEKLKEILKKLGYRFDFFHYNNAYCSKHKMSINEIKINDYFQNEWYVDDKLIYQYEKDKF